MKGAFRGASAADATRASEVLVRYNQAGKSNLLQTVTNPLGGGFTLDYSREGNFVGNFYSGKNWTFDMPSARWCLSSVTTFDNFQHSYTDTIQYGPMDRGSDGIVAPAVGSGFYDRVEKEFYGFSHVRVIHGDGFQHMYYYRNDAYYAQGTIEGTLDAAVKNLDDARKGAGEESQCEGGPEEVVADKGYHSKMVLLSLRQEGWRTYIAEPQRGRQKWPG